MIIGVHHLHLLKSAVQFIYFCLWVVTELWFFIYYHCIYSCIFTENIICCNCLDLLTSNVINMWTYFSLQIFGMWWVNNNSEYHVQNKIIIDTLICKPWQQMMPSVEIHEYMLDNNCLFVYLFLFNYVCDLKYFCVLHSVLYLMHLIMLDTMFVIKLIRTGKLI